MFKGRKIEENTSQMNPTGHDLMSENQEDGATSPFIHQDPTFPFGAWDFQPVSDFELDALMHPQWMSLTSQVDRFEDLSLWDFDFYDQNSSPNDGNSNPVVLVDNLDAIIDNDDSDAQTRMYSISNNNDSMNHGACKNGKRKSRALRLEDVQKYFNVPITRAAKELNVGLTALKRRCRELNIMRWPHRRIKSLESLIHNVKDLGMSSEVKRLEEQKRLVEKIPEMELCVRTKKLRQSCFKANYKKRRSIHS